jgi:tetratricopeptide (TPR) repeat protein
VLLQHPLGTDAQVAWHFDFLTWLGARDQATRVLDAGLVRFRASAELHQRLRDRLLMGRGGIAAVEAAYDKMLAEKNAPPELEGFAGLASMTVADQLRRGRAWEPAAAAYGRAIAHYERAITLDPPSKDASDRAIAFAFAGRARIAYQLDHDEQALQEILSSFHRKPDAAGDKDGVGVTPGETGQMLLARLKATKKDDLAHELDMALSLLDPELLKPDRN